MAALKLNEVTLEYVRCKIHERHMPPVPGLGKTIDSQNVLSYITNIMILIWKPAGGGYR